MQRLTKIYTDPSRNNFGINDLLEQIKELRLDVDEMTIRKIFGMSSKDFLPTLTLSFAQYRELAILSAKLASMQQNISEELLQDELLNIQPFSENNGLAIYNNMRDTIRSLLMKKKGGSSDQMYENKNPFNKSSFARN
jgi:hypothetical protein